MRFSRALLPGLLLSPLAFASGTTEQPVMKIQAAAIEEQLSSELSALGHQVEVITAAEIRRTGATDVSKALQMLVPSLYVARKNGDFDYATVSLQGSRTKDVLFLVDGVRISNRLFGGTSPLDTLASHMVERIEVVKGGQSLFYGTQAVAGAINIITKNFSDQPQGSVVASITSEVDQRGLAFDHRGALSSDTRYVIALSGDKADGYQPWDDSAIQPDNQNAERGYQAFNGLLKLQHDFDTSRLSVSLQRNDAKLDYARPYRNIDTFNDRVETIATVKWDQDLSEALGLTVKAYYHDWDTRYTRIENIAGVRTVVDDKSFWGYTDKGVNAMLRYTPDSQSELIGGIDYQRYDGEDNVLLIKTRTEVAKALFGQYRYQFSDSTQAAFGIRNSNSDLGGSNTIWNGSVRHQFSDQLFGSVALGTSYLLPDAYQLYAIDPDHPRGNEDLDGEESRNLNLVLGGSLAQGDFNWELSGYHRRVKGLIKSARAVVDGQTVSTRVNSDSKVTGKGLGLAMGYRFTPQWQGRMSFDYNRLRFDDSNQQVDDVPETLAKLGLQYNAGQWSVGADAAYVGTTYDTISPFGRQKFGNHWQMDINGRWQFAPQQSVSLNVANLFNQDNVSGLARGDVADGSRYLYENQVQPRTVKLTYQLDF